MNRKFVDETHLPSVASLSSKISNAQLSLFRRIPLIDSLEAKSLAIMQVQLKILDGYCIYFMELEDAMSLDLQKIKVRIHFTCSSY